MTRRPIIEDLNVLNQFHPEPETSLDQTTTIRAQARLEQIMSTPRQTDLDPMVSTRLNQRAGQATLLRGMTGYGSPAPRTTSSRVRAIRWAAIPVAAAAAFLAGSLLPHSPMVQPAQATIRGWTAAPLALEGDQLSVADQSCRAGLNGFMDTSTHGLPLTPAGYERQALAQISGAPSAAEQRGDWALLAYLTDGGQAVTCLAWLAAPGGPMAVNGLLSGTFVFKYDAEAGGFVRQENNPRGHFSGGGGNIAYRGFGSGEQFSNPLLFAAMYIGSDSMAQQFTLENGEIFSTIQAPVDPDVKEVVVHSVNSGDVVATVADGFFIAWWPGSWSLNIDQLRAAEGSIAGAIVSGYTVTRADGSTEFFELNR
jgi:hypothetical protein